MLLKRVIQWGSELHRRTVGVFKSHQKEEPDNLICPGVDRDSEIINAQCFLRKMGFPIGSTGPNQDGVDGIIGEMTEAAVNMFRQMVELKVDGSLNR